MPVRGVEASKLIDKARVGQGRMSVTTPDVGQSGDVWWISSVTLEKFTLIGQPALRCLRPCSFQTTRLHEASHLGV